MSSTFARLVNDFLARFEGVPFVVGVALDESGSVKEVLGAWDIIKGSASRIIQKMDIAPGRGRAMLVKFNGAVTLVQDFTESATDLLASLAPLKEPVGGITQAGLVMEFLLSHTSEAGNAKRAIIFVTDGDVSQISVATKQKLIKENIQLLVLAVGKDAEKCRSLSDVPNATIVTVKDFDELGVLNSLISVPPRDPVLIKVKDIAADSLIVAVKSPSEYSEGIVEYIPATGESQEWNYVRFVTSPVTVPRLSDRKEYKIRARVKYTSSGAWSRTSQPVRVSTFARHPKTVILKDIDRVRAELNRLKTLLNNFEMPPHLRALGVYRLKIALLGRFRSGKTSFSTSACSALRGIFFKTGRIAAEAGSVTKEVSMVLLNESGTICLMDTFGWDATASNYTQVLGPLMNGFAGVGLVEGADIDLSNLDRSATIEDRIQSVGIVFELDSPHASVDTETAARILADLGKKYDVNPLAIITHVDQQARYGLTTHTLDQVYENTYVRESAQKFSEQTNISQDDIYPVANISGTDSEFTERQQLLVLWALEAIVAEGIKKLERDYERALFIVDASASQNILGHYLKPGDKVGIEALGHVSLATIRNMAPDSIPAGFKFVGRDGKPIEQSQERTANLRSTWRVMNRMHQIQVQLPAVSSSSSSSPSCNAENPARAPAPTVPSQPEPVNVTKVAVEYQGRSVGVRGVASDMTLATLRPKVEANLRVSEFVFRRSDASIVPSAKESTTHIIDCLVPNASAHTVRIDSRDAERVELAVFFNDKPIARLRWLTSLRTEAASSSLLSATPQETAVDRSPITPSTTLLRIRQEILSQFPTIKGDFMFVDAFGCGVGLMDEEAVPLEECLIVSENRINLTNPL